MSRSERRSEVRRLIRCAQVLEDLAIITRNHSLFNDVRTLRNQAAKILAGGIR
ncbi:MAG: hypothetical protein ACRC67_13710 [Inquilinus sp.]|uniref:hypothetical protein n=1 Tax=Inquilinus sp. TaxID=1932117 RepID=UPI003F3A2396